MLRKRKNRAILNILYNPKVIAFLGLLIIILISIPLAKSVTKRYTVNQEIKGLENEIIALESKSKGFKKVLTYLDSDEFIEEKARLNLGLKKAGEEVVVINKKTVDLNESLEAVIDSDIENNLSNPQKWWRYFFLK